MFLHLFQNYLESCFVTKPGHSREVLAMTIQGWITRAAGARRVVFVGQCIVGTVVIALLTTVGVIFHFNLSSSGLLFLLIVALMALFCGFWQATVISIVALACQVYYFVPPTYAWSVADSRNYVSLLVFECTALMVSRLSAREEKSSRESDRRRQDMERLYRLSRQTLTLDLNRVPGPKVLELIVEIFDVEAAAIFDADLVAIDTWGSWPADVKELARNTYLFDISQDDAMLRLSRRVLRLGTVPIGALLLRGKVTPLAMDAIASLAAITFDRYRSFANETRAEAAHQSEQLRTTVLDRLAHEFKTPLTAIRTASAGLLEIGDLSSMHADLAKLIEEESIALNDLTTRLLQTARLEPGEFDVNKEQVAIADVIEEVVAEQSGQVGDHAIEVSIHDRTLVTRGDRELLAAIVRQFVDNAAKYSYPGSKIGISAEQSASEIVIAVHNEGDPIRLQDREKIFERYYRCPESEHRAPGTGIGLSIARKAAEIHHGHVWVISDKQEGTTFFLSIQGLKGKNR